MEKKIIALGLPSSGKSCYLSVAVGFMFRHRMYDIVGLNRNLQELTDEIKERMQSGKWVGKTTGRMEYQFTKKGWWEKVSWFDTEYILHDWNGEYFQLLGLDEEQAKKGWAKAQEYIDGKKVAGNELSDLYEADCRDADAILLFIDGKTLIEKANDGESEKNRTRESLYTLVDILRQSKKKRVISIVLTKSDYLENYGEFLDTNRKINAKNVEDCMRDNYNATFSEIESAGHKVHVSLVSCIPVREHRSSLSGRGAVPNGGWAIDDLEKSNVNMSSIDMPNDMLAPIRWVIDNA